MIKPEMVSDELIEAAEAGCGMGCGAWDCVDEKEVAAAILNAAIEAGLVSLRLPATDDPRVLRRIIDLMMRHMDACDILNVSFDDWKTEATRTIETKA